MLRTAVERGTPVTRHELIDFYTEDGFETNLELLSHLYDLPKEKILEGLA
jgi:hypothetical protein